MTDAERLAEINDFTFQIESDMDRRYEADTDDVRGLIADVRWLIDQLKAAQAENEEMVGQSFLWPEEGKSLGRLLITVCDWLKTIGYVEDFRDDLDVPEGVRRFTVYVKAEVLNKR